MHWIIEKNKWIPEKHLLLLYWLLQSLWLCISQQTNTRNPYLSPEKSVCRSRSISYNWTWNNRLVPNRERSTSRLYIVIMLINLYAEYIMWNARLDEAQAGIKISGSNINNLRYTDDTTLMAEREEKLKSLLMKVRAEWKSWLKAQHSKN